MKLKIILGETPADYKVVNAETGEEVENVNRIDINIIKGSGLGSVQLRVDGIKIEKAGE